MSDKPQEKKPGVRKPKMIPTAKKRLKTFREFFEAVPDAWLDGLLCLHDGYNVYQVQRIALHMNEDGRKVVVMHYGRLTPLEKP